MDIGRHYVFGRESCMDDNPSTSHLLALHTLLDWGASMDMQQICRVLDRGLSMWRRKNKVEGWGKYGRNGRDFSLEAYQYQTARLIRVLT
jgi:hypothetical protein